MYAIIQNDLILGRTSEPQKHGQILKETAQFDQLRFDGEKIVSVADLALEQFYIDNLGQKHIVDFGEGWQSLTCQFGDQLVRDNGVWRVRNTDDDHLEDKQKVDQFRQSEYTRRVRPYLEEADIKKHMGDQDEYTRLMDLAVQERAKIQAENPWPTPPEN
ncbi:hypothetical protein [Vibrio mediterranei]|uniref:Uncharacterized protein n=1 Tax=Vibrio mediterranei TaxID=689 RepID=A0A3G4V844_9VIBR|nr:hypothetical protein [Vibrio mediterranei]AYV20489.1 hypothetical protein ECB94_03850 [Vibrio mediterranei]